MVHDQSATFDIGGELTVNRLAYGAMRLTGDDILGPPDDDHALRRRGTAGYDSRIEGGCGRCRQSYRSGVLPGCERVSIYSNAHYFREDETITWSV
jgi:hypothetical protein